MINMKEMEEDISEYLVPHKVGKISPSRKEKGRHNFKIDYFYCLKIFNFFTF